MSSKRIKVRDWSAAYVRYRPVGSISDYSLVEWLRNQNCGFEFASITWSHQYSHIRGIFFVEDPQVMSLFLIKFGSYTPEILTEEMREALFSDPKYLIFMNWDRNELENDND
jgi:hypothetical protein